MTPSGRFKDDGRKDEEGEKGAQQSSQQYRVNLRAKRFFRGDRVKYAPPNEKSTVGHFLLSSKLGRVKRRE